MVRALWVVMLVTLVGCSTPAPADDAAALASDASFDSAALDASVLDAAMRLDGGTSSATDAGADAFVALDAVAISDAFMLPDAFTPPDAFMPADAYAARDAYVSPDASWASFCVDIDVSNTCAMSVSPTSVSVPHGQQPMFCWRNRSRDYPIDVWLSYGGGYTDLAMGATWNEPVRHCLGPNAHDEYADISTACSSFHFLIHCL